MTITQLKEFSPLLAHRVNALGEDGYIVVTISDLMHAIFIKCRHLTNGNVITIFAYKATDTMRQFTNSKLTYQGDITG